MIVVYAALAWFVGLVMASLFPFPLPVWLGAVGLAVAGILLSLRRPSIRLPFLVLAAMGLGGARYILSIPAIDTGHVAFYNGTDVVLTGVVNDEPELRDTTLRLDLRVESLTIAEKRHAPRLRARPRQCRTLSPHPLWGTHPRHWPSGRAARL